MTNTPFPLRFCRRALHRAPLVPQLRRRWLLSLALLATLLAAGCPDGCIQTPAPPVEGAGTLTARPVTGGFELVLNDLDRPLRTLSVAVVLGAGATATRVEAAGPVAHDLIEAGLDAPRSAFTVVVADTRRIPLDDGAIARVDVDGAGSVTLTAASAVDDQGASIELTVDAQ